MNREEYFKFHQAMTEKMNVITRAKNADYTGAAGDDPFANFNRVASLGVCSTEQGFMVRMLDKYMRINSFVQKGFLNVKDESVEDTLLDLANYAILFAGYLKSKKGDEKFGYQSGAELTPAAILYGMEDTALSAMAKEVEKEESSPFNFGPKINICSICNTRILSHEICTAAPHGYVHQACSIGKK